MRMDRAQGKWSAETVDGFTDASVFRKVILCTGTWLALHTSLGWWKDACQGMGRGDIEGSTALGKISFYLLSRGTSPDLRTVSLTTQVVPDENRLKQKEQGLLSSTFLICPKCLIKSCCHYNSPYAWSRQERLDVLLDPMGGSMLRHLEGKELNGSLYPSKYFLQSLQNIIGSLFQALPAKGEMRRE